MGYRLIEPYSLPAIKIAYITLDLHTIWNDKYLSTEDRHFHVGLGNDMIMDGHVCKGMLGVGIC